MGMLGKEDGLGFGKKTNNRNADKRIQKRKTHRAASRHKPTTGDRRKEGGTVIPVTKQEYRKESRANWKESRDKALHEAKGSRKPSKRGGKRAKPKKK